MWHRRRPRRCTCSPKRFSVLPLMSSRLLLDLSLRWHHTCRLTTRTRTLCRSRSSPFNSPLSSVVVTLPLTGVRSPSARTSASACCPPYAKTHPCPTTATGPLATDEMAREPSRRVAESWCTCVVLSVSWLVPLSTSFAERSVSCSTSRVESFRESSPPCERVTRG